MPTRSLTFGLLALMAGLCLDGLVRHHIFSQRIWDDGGPARLALFALLYLTLLPWPRVLAAAALVYTCVVAGPLAVLSLAWLCAGAWAAGLLWLSTRPVTRLRRPALVFTLGLATFAAFLMLTARWPIHYSALYWLVPLAPLAAAYRRRILAWPRLTSIRPVALFPLACAWLAALLPEVSSDGLAMHAVIPARITWLHHWSFDSTEFAWAVMPMGGDFAFSLAWLTGGEAAARLLNLFLLALIALALADRLRGRAWRTSAVVAAFLATPLVQHVTGSLFVENWVALLILAAVLLHRAHPFASAFLGGLAVASKLGALAFIVPLALAAGYRSNALALLIGAVPYLEAWLRTGNPVYPFFTSVTDARFHLPLTWSSFHDIHFHSSRFIEGLDGSAGFLVFVLLPPALLYRRRWPRSALWTAVAGAIVTFSAQSNLRYLYPALPLLALVIATSVARSRALAATAWAVFALNLALLPAAGWYHREFYTTDRAAYLELHAPERKLVDWLNAHGGAPRAAWLNGSAIGYFRGRSYSAVWHSLGFSTQLKAARSAAGVLAAARSHNIDYFIAPQAAASQSLLQVHTREFLDLYTAPVAASGRVELRRLSTAPHEPGWARPGDYDEITGETSFAGRWTRDLQFAAASNGTLAYSDQPEASWRARFEGASVRLIYTAAANRCRALVSIDGGPPAELNQRSLATHWRAESPRYFAPPGRHTVELRAAPGQAGCHIDIDGFRVE